ncbi:MAG: hypothetical protein Q7T00_01715 [Rugosibacter sp.]|nr:hypothetical protein [Rugosibacter sp.]MDO9271606.1 hypothetical protein [Rugosibacter sp.]
MNQTAITHEEAIKRAIHETQMHRLLRPKNTAGLAWATLFMPAQYGLSAYPLV